jgi:hypothetical protein
LDADGSLKCVLDSLNGIVYSSDKFALPRVIDYYFDAERPRMKLEIVSPPPLFCEMCESTT